MNRIFLEIIIILIILSTGCPGVNESLGKSNKTDENKIVSTNNIFNMEEETKAAIEYISNIVPPKTTIGRIKIGLGINEDLNNIKITKIEQTLLKSINNLNINLNNADTNIGLKFSYLVCINNQRHDGRLMIFLHGNTCAPEELMGLKKPENADPIVNILTEKGFMIIIPCKYDMYQVNDSSRIVAAASIYGTTLEALEQYKISAIINYNRENSNKLYIYGFSHGCWQAILASILNKIDVIIIQDFIVDVKKFTNEISPFYLNYNNALLTIWNYPELFKLSSSRKIIIFHANQGAYTDKAFLKNVVDKSPSDKVKLSYYDGGHYVYEKLINEASKY